MAATLFASDGVTLTEEGRIFTLSLNRGECRINPTSIELISEALGVVERDSDHKALVIVGAGKFFCNGLDVEWMLQNGKEAADAMVQSYWGILARILVLDCHTICAINGHAFGAGLFLALACDWRIMSSGKAWVNFPEANLGMRLSKGFAELSKAKLPPATLRIAVLTGKRFTSSEALAHGIVDAESSEGKLLEESWKMATGLLPANLKLARFNSDKFKQMKIELYTDAYRALVAADGTSATPESRL